MTILEFLKSEIIVESENDVYIDAESYDEESLDFWIEEFLYDLLDEDEKSFVENYDFESYEELKEILKDDECILAKKLINSALLLKRQIPREEVYYINNSGSFHLEVPRDALI